MLFKTYNINIIEICTFLIHFIKYDSKQKSYMNVWLNECISPSRRTSQANLIGYAKVLRFSQRPTKNVFNLNEDNGWIFCANA